MRIEMPGKVKQIIRRLTEYGFEAYAVGGCVRDSILGRDPHDWDITTSARPMQVKELFSHTVDTGIQHGTVTVMIGREGFEVTTYRVDGVYEDARHPKEVFFTPDLSEDLKRRDFTVNAMAYNDEAGLVDLYDGTGDIARGQIRCVGKASERFGEDALRMLRAVRFAAQLGYEIEEETRRAILLLAANLEKISAERIREELLKILLSPHPEMMEEVYLLGMADVILPEFSVMMETRQSSRHHLYPVGEHTLHALQLVRPDKVLRLAMLFHDAAKPVCIRTDQNGIDHFRGHPQEGARMTKEIMRRLKFDNDTIRRVVQLVRWHDDKPPLKPACIRRAIVRVGADAYPQIFEVMRADIGAQSGYMQQEKYDYVDAYEAMYNKILADGDCLSVKDLAVNGSDLIGWGLQPGREIGAVLKLMLDDVLEDPALNTEERLRERYEKGLFRVKNV